MNSLLLTQGKAEVLISKYPMSVGIIYILHLVCNIPHAFRNKRTSKIIQ